MRNVNNLLADFYIGNIKKNLLLSPNELEQFGYNISGNDKLENLEIRDVVSNVKYLGNLERYFILGIRRKFSVKAVIIKETGTKKLFKEELVYEGRWHLRNDGNGEVEALITHPFPEYENVIWNLCKPDSCRVTFTSDYSDFLIDEFPK